MRKQDDSMVLQFTALTFVGMLSYSAGSCPAPAPCSCVDGVINCLARRLKHVPTILPVPGNFTTLNMGTNYILTIPNAAFSTLNIINLYLDYNNIRYVDDFAFKGLESLKVLYLQHNRLMALPDALKFFLVNLNVIDVSYNLIDGQRGYVNKTVDGFTDDVMTILGNKIKAFTFGDPFGLLHWPGSLSHLQELNYLHMSGGIIKYLPSSPFSGFEHTIETLWIENTQLRQMPLDIGRMTHIRHLRFDNNIVDDGDSVIVESIFRYIGDTLETLSLKYDNLTKFPEGIKYLVNLRNLSLDGNHLKYISDESISSIGNGNLTSLSLKHCELHRIPGAISDLTSITELDLSENNIRTIESKDLVNLPNLLSVSFQGNPLMFISRTAFHGLPSLTKIDFSNTKITQIPEALQNLYRLQEVDLSRAPVDCTCDMFWVKRWFDVYRVKVDIRGRCETIDSLIESYIEGRVTHCPQYADGPFG